MFIHICLLIFTFLCFVNFTMSARILMIMPTASISHHIFYRPLIKELALRGHDVVSVTPDPINDPTLTNLTEIDIHEEAYGAFSVAKWLEDSKNEPDSTINKLRKFAPYWIQMADTILSSPKVKALIKNNHNEHFDIFINEMQIYPYTFAFKERYNCPVVGISSMDAFMNGMDAIGNYQDANYYAGVFIKDGVNLSLWERLEMLWHQIDYRIFYYLQYMPKLNELVKKHFDMKAKSLWEIEKSVDLILTNTNPIFQVPRPLMPNLIEIGGMYTSERKSLPQDLQTFMDNSKSGVIYFSLGSNIKSENLPIETRKILLQTLEQLPYNVVWKFGENRQPDIPKNVLIKKWLPQQEVLDHPNLKAFVTQGGIHSLEESIRNNVPMVCIPFGGDQIYNANRVVVLGIGRQVLYKEITTELLTESIIDVATNNKYKNNIRKIAKLIYDQPTKPLDRAVWWIEHVIRHRGAQHLRSPAANLPWYKYFLLDIIVFILGISIVFITFIIYFIKIVLKHVLSVESKLKRE